jgi:hypothetical protein
VIFYSEDSQPALRGNGMCAEPSAVDDGDLTVLSDDVVLDSIKSDCDQEEDSFTHPTSFNCFASCVCG